jgi:hypothetical protein
LLALPPVDAVHMMREGRGGQIDAVTTQLYALFHACKPITVDTHGKTFFEVWFSLPDPGNLRSLHVKLWKDVWKDYSSDDSIVARRKLASTSVFSVLSRLIQSIYNVSMVCL